MSSSTGIPALDNTMGVMFIGVVFAMGLWGASSVQVYYYYNRFPKDELWMKCLVALVWALDTCHQGLITHMIYTYLITEYGNSAFLALIVNTLLIEVAVSALVVFFVQSFFVLRVWKLSQKNIAIAVVLSSVVLASLILQLVYTYKSLHFKTYVQLTTIFGLSRAINIMSAISDVLISGALIYYLQSSRTGFRRSDSIINRLILFTMNTGLLTALDAIMSLISNTVWSNTFIYILFYVCISRLYSNSLMATLNSRRSNGGVDENTGEQSMSLSGRGGYRSRAVELEAPGIAKTHPHTLSIKVNTETETVRDQEEGKINHGIPAESDSDLAYPYGDAKAPSYHAH